MLAKLVSSFDRAAGETRSVPRYGMTVNAKLLRGVRRVINEGSWTTGIRRADRFVMGWDDEWTRIRRTRDINFHFKWGPGWYPIPYTGTAFSQ